MHEQQKQWSLASRVQTNIFLFYFIAAFFVSIIVKQFVALLFSASLICLQSWVESCGQVGWR